MKIIFEQEEHDTLFFIDAEYEFERVIQFSGIIFTKIKTGVYDLMGSFNLYINDNGGLSNFTQAFTGISPNFIASYGIPYPDLNHFWRDLISNYRDILIVAHNMKGDCNVLFKNGVNLDKFDHYDTYNMAKKYWPNEISFKVFDLAAAQGYFSYSPHDSFSDAWGLVPIFAALKEREAQSGK